MLKQPSHPASLALTILTVLLVAILAPGFGASAQQALPTWTELSSSSGDLPVPTGGPQQTALLSGDLDNDGDVDLVVGSRLGSNSVIWYQRSGTSWTILPVEADGLRIEAGGSIHDVDSDGLLDIVMGGDIKSSEIWWWKNPGLGGWGTTWQRFTIKSSGDTKHHGMGFGDFDNDGQVELAYWNQGAGNSANDLYIADVPPDPTTVTDWPTQLVFDATTVSEGLDVADIDGDGDDDIVAGGYIIDDAPDGTYTVTAVNTAETASQWVAGDIVAGGRLELVSSSGDAVGGLGLYTWTGDGWARTDLLGPDLPGPWDRGHTLELGDVNGDGYVDIFTAEMTLTAGATARSAVLYGDGLGNFKTDIVSTGVDNHQSLLTDLDGDGDLDIASKPFDQSTPSIRLYVNAYDAAPIGPWARRQVGLRSGRASWIRAADMNADGLLDLVSGNSWMENPGTIDAVWPEHVFDAPLIDIQLVLDLDGDGDLDVFGSGALSSRIFAWGENDGQGNFTTRTNIGTGAKDFIQGIDWIQGPDGIEIWFAWHKRQFGIDRIVVPADPVNTAWTIQPTGLPAQGEAIELVDVDGDSDIDVLQGHIWSRNDGGGTYSDFVLHNPTRWDFPDSEEPNDRLPDRVVSADMNGDGRLDVVVTHEADPNNTVVWFEQPVDPTQEWPERFIFSGDYPLLSLDVADIDGDGDFDVVVGEHDPSGNDAGRVMILQNLSGNGLVWGEREVYDREENHDGTQLADLDGDGDLDIYTIGWQQNRVVVHENLTTSLAAPIWLDSDRRYRIDVEMRGGDAVVTDQPATVDLNFSDALASAGGTGSIAIDSLRVVEIGEASQLLDANVPFQFDTSQAFDAGSFATGEMVLLMVGDTPPSSNRRYQVYFDVVGSAATPVLVAPRLTTTQGVVDAGLNTTRIETQAGTWYYDTAGGGFSSLDDADGNDWIGFSSATGALGEFRGIPNLVAPADGGYLHPGAMTAASVVTRSGPIRTTIESTVPGTAWSMQWQIYPGWAVGTVTGTEGNYWFQYEGVPGGSLSSADVVHRLGSPSIGGLDAFSADLADPEWMAAADPVVGRALVSTQFTPDTAVDSYRDQDDLMTVMTFGRPSTSTTPLLDGVGRRFTVGLIDDVTAQGAQSAAMAFGFEPNSVVVRSISTTGLTGPGGGWTGGGPTVPPGPTTTLPSPPTTTSPTTTPTPGAQATQRFSFGRAQAPEGWVRADGEAFDGNWGWVAADGQVRQCGERITNPDPVLDTFCHANTRYELVGGTWNAIDSPASWKTALANGTYEVRVTVGEARFQSASIAHSVQVEGVVVHDRVSTTDSIPFRTATVTVMVTDAMLDLTFEGGSKTKIVSLEITAVDPPVSTTTTGTTGPTVTTATTTTATTTTSIPPASSSTAAPSTTAPVTTVPPTSGPGTTAPATAAPSTTAPPTAATQRFTFGKNTAPAGWTPATGDLFDGVIGWIAADGIGRQCGQRNTNPNPVLDAFCHAITRYELINGNWNAIASPASWRTAIPNGNYNITVTVGETRFQSPSIAHSVQAEGLIVHDRVTTTNANPFRTATIPVTISDGFLDLTFNGGSKTKIVSVEISPA